MRFYYLQHLTWVLLCGLVILLGQGAVSVSEESIKEVTAVNVTVEKNSAPVKIINDHVYKRPQENLSDGINAVPLSPEDDVDEASILSPQDQNGESLKQVPEQSERIPKILDTPNANVVVSDPSSTTVHKVSAKFEANSTETPEDYITTIKSSTEESSQYDYSPKGRTLSYEKDNSSRSDNADLLKNTVPSEPKAIKLEENTDKEGERWLKKQKGISNPSQSTTEFKSRVNKERNLSGSYLPALAVLNAVNRTSETSQTNTDKFIKYQRRKRPWSVQVNSSDFSIPEETTVWSLASLKATPKNKPYLDVKPVTSWSTNFNRPTTEYHQQRPSSAIPTPAPPPLLDISSSTSLSSGGSDWTGISKTDAIDASSTGSSVGTNKPFKLVEANFTSPSSSLNLIDSSSDKDILNETVNPLNHEISVKNATRPSNSTKTPEFSNVISEPEMPIKALPSPPPPPSVTVRAVSSTESVKNLSVYPSPLSNSVNELHDEADPEEDRSLVPVESSLQNNIGTEHPFPADYGTKSTTQRPVVVDHQVNSSFDNSHHPNVTKMFLGKESYASNFEFSTTPSTTVDISTNVPDINKRESFTNISQDQPTLITKVDPTMPIVTTSTKTPLTTSTSEKIVHLTSTMLPDKSKESLVKVTPVPVTSAATLEPSSTNENDFSIKLVEMFNVTPKADASSPVAPVVTTTLKPSKVLNSPTTQPKEVNEIPLDIENVSTPVELENKTMPSTVLTSSIPPPITSELEENVTVKDDSGEEPSIKTNDVTIKTDLLKNTTNLSFTSFDAMNTSSTTDTINSTEAFSSLATSKPIPPVITVDNVTIPSSVEPSTESHIEEDLSLNETLPVDGPKEQEAVTKVETRAPSTPSYSTDNSSRIQEETTPKFYPTTDEPQKIGEKILPSQDVTPSPTVELSEETSSDVHVTEDHGSYAGQDEVIFDSSDPVFTRLLVQANDKELCSSKEQLRDSIIKLFRTNGSDIHRKQVVINNLGSKECLFRKSPTDEGLYPIQVYLTNSQGHNDVILTDQFIDLWQREGLDFYYPVKRVDKVIGRSNLTETNSKSEGNSSLIAAIVISSIAGVCLLFIVILLVIIRKRQKGFNYGQRCTPVSLEDYSLDNISVYNSTRRKAARASKRSYGNPAFDDPGATSHVVNFATLANFSSSRSLMDEEFSRIPTVSVKPDELPPGAETKNRFANVIPIPETRVVLTNTKGTDPEIDSYINANFVKGAKGEEKFYIACQAPTVDTIADFWQMIWEQQSRLIIMLTDLQEGGVEKCADYLPPSEVLDCHRVFGDLQVTLKKREVREKYVISNLQLKNLESNLWREVVHMWLTSWPVQGVPSEPTPVIAFLIEARSYIKSKETHSPIVVHCSPGTGRTGTILAIDICIRDFEIKRTIDVPRTVANIRRERAGAVQTKDQYAFIYQVLHTYATKLTGGGLDSI